MKEIPILFNGEMVRAILDGSKTQTRRPMKPQPSGFTKSDNIPYKFNGKSIHPYISFQGIDVIKSPFGKPGDVLWVRETFMYDPPCDGTWPHYGDSFETCDIPKRFRKPEHIIHKEGWKTLSEWIWKPSIHMPKWACRIKLKVKRVWVERVQDISEADAIAEGIERIKDNMPPYAYFGWKDYSSDDELPFDSDKPVASFKSLWQSIYKNLDDNPWVWCCEFEETT